LIKKITLMPGEYYASKEDVVIKTILGSCISACLYDPENHVVGMNHFLLSGSCRVSRSMPFFLSEAGRYGVNAMELVINDMLKLGAKKENLRAKVFGGAYILRFKRNCKFFPVGEMNCIFIREFLKNEGIKIVASSLGGEEGRVIYFHSSDFSVYHRKIKRTIMPEIIKEEEKLLQKGTKDIYKSPELWTS